MNQAARFSRKVAFHMAIAVGMLGMLPLAVRAADTSATEKVAPTTQSTTTQASAAITGLRAGFSGRFKVGCWSPFLVELQGVSEARDVRVELVALDGDGVPSRVRSAEVVRLEAGEKKSVVLYCKIGQLASDVIVSLLDDSAIIATRSFSTRPDGELAGILSSGATLVVAVGNGISPADENSLRQRGITLVRFANFSQLPTEWWGYESVDAAIVTTGSDGTVAELAAESPQLSALKQWIRLGGRMVLSVGRQGEKLLTPSSPLASLAPGAFESLVPLRQSTMLETYVETNDALAMGGSQALSVPKLRDVQGRIEAYAGSNRRDLPLVVRTPVGFGEVAFVAFDLDQPPIDRWPARARLLDKLLRLKTAAGEQSDDTLGEVTTLGFVDLAGQLRGALDQFPAVPLVPFWLVAVLVVAYILCIGPVDYYLVKKLLGHPEWTWFTFAATVLLFSGGALALAYNLKGREVRVNQIELVDFDAETKQVRGTAWVNLFSPEVATYDVSLTSTSASKKNAADAGAVADQQTSTGWLFSWFGLPGSGFGGMDSSGRGFARGFSGDASARGLSLFTEPYDYSPHLDKLERVPLAMWSSKPFVGRWWKTEAAGIEADLSDSGRLVGRLTSNLTSPLTDCVLLFDRWAFVIREFKPGATLDVESDIEAQTVDTYLRHVTVKQDQQFAPPYERQSLDVPRIVEIMTAHDLAGGERYTGLVNQFQSFTELSGLVRSGRAVLIGRSPQPATRLDHTTASSAPAADPQTWTFHRYIFPVRPPTN